MREVMRNQRLIGSTMGSLADLHDAIAFAAKHRIIPPVSTVIRGLEEAEQGFEEMKNDRGSIGGKIVIDLNLNVEEATKPPKSRL
jgi:D-arabinose 1-dehydrogenase-like Zn-dependent alcohol dehydrogenase